MLWRLMILMTLLHSFFHKFRKNQLKKCIFDIFKGWRSWYIFERCSICSLGGIMYVFTKLGDQNIYRQMGSSHEYVLLYSIHSNTILSTILHNNSWSNSCWYRCSTNVECKMHISNSGKHVVNIVLRISVFLNDLYIKVYFALFSPSMFQVGNRYAELSGVPVEPIIVRFFGIFFLFFQSSSVWGHLISSASK